MEVLRGVNEAFKLQYPLAGRVETKSGAEFSKEINLIKLGEGYRVLMSWDFDDAYTNVDKQMIFEAVVKCCDYASLSN